MDTIGLAITITQALLRLSLFALDIYGELVSFSRWHVESFFEVLAYKCWRPIYDITVCAILFWVIWDKDLSHWRKVIIYGDIVTNIALASTIGPWDGELRLPEYLRVGVTTLYLIGDWVQYRRTWEEPSYANLFSLSELEIDDGPGEPEWYEVEEDDHDDDHDHDDRLEKGVNDDLRNPDGFEEKGLIS